MSFFDKRIKIIFAFIAISIFFAGCSKKLIEEGDKLYKDKNYLEAVKYFDKYYNTYPDNSLSEYASYMSGIIYSNQLNCDTAKSSFEFLIKNYPRSKYYDESYFRSFICPNYIYPYVRKLYFGDSKSYGKNARETVEFESKNFKRIQFTSKIYAGNKLLVKQRKEYIINGLTVIEKTGKINKIILKYPLNESWSYSTDGIEYRYEVFNVPEVDVKAGKFYNSIKVIETAGKSNSKIANYYAVDFGRIMTSSIFSGRETRIMELIKYE